MHRRQFLVTAPAIGFLGATQSTANHSASADKPLKLAGYDYDRVRAIMDGEVGLPGHQVQFEASDIYVT